MDPAGEADWLRRLISATLASQERQRLGREVAKGWSIAYVRLVIVCNRLGWQT
jgi:hypothetical protein